ncbi:hypothetical protein JCM24511_08073 [Saitozyma sp. JCM 24511]|nr:hypothetical protein JCM24511_08073 [Saitozyma sp. JCM 24511]
MPLRERKMGGTGGCSLGGGGPCGQVLVYKPAWVLVLLREAHGTGILVCQRANQAIDYGWLQSNPFPPGIFADITRVLRFGNLGTSVAISGGQGEKLDLDLNHDNAIYTSIMVLDKPEELWNSSRHQGRLFLPTLGVMGPMTVGDMVFFNASELPHLVIKLDEADNHKRTIVTTFTCAQMADVLEHPPAFCLPWMRP